MAEERIFLTEWLRDCHVNLDAEPLTKVCKKCQLHSHLDKDSEEYHRWRAEHNNCKANYKGSAPAMESEGADRIFRRSVATHKLRYTDLYSDGDSKSYNRVKDVLLCRWNTNC